jgi:hypothetical protein
MQAENFGPSVVPTSIAIWNCPFWPPPGLPLADEPAPLGVVAVVVGVEEPATLAIPGEPPPPPQPAASSANAAATTRVTMNGRRQRIAQLLFGRQRIDCEEG